MKKLTGKQKGAIGFVAAIVGAAAYFFAQTMGWIPVKSNTEPNVEKAPIVESQASVTK